MHLLNLTLGQFFAVFGSITALALALYLLDRSRRRQVVATLRFWLAADQPPVITRRRHIQQPLSLFLQLLGIALLLLAAAQLRLGGPAGAPRDHVLLLETSAWMSASAGGRTLMDAARDRALAYIRSLPARDRLMIVRADALATPATVFEPDRRKLEEAVLASQPGSMGLNLQQALAFARGIQSQGGRRAGEIVFVGSGRVARGESAMPAGAPPNLRALLVPDQVENCGLRKIGVRRAQADPALWDIYVSLRNYGALPRTVSLALSFGPSRGGGGAVAVGARRLVLQPGAEAEVAFEHRTLAAGLLEANLYPRDGFADDDRAVLELPEQPLLPVAVYSDDPELLRPLLAADPRLRPSFHAPSEFRATGLPGLVILDRFRPAGRPAAHTIWIDPPADGSPIPVRQRLAGAKFAGWNAAAPLAAGLRAKDLKLQTVSVFAPAPTDIRVGEVTEGPVIVARPGEHKTVVVGFHPGAMRYELAAPLLFANIVRWMEPEVFRRWDVSASSVGTVTTTLDSETNAGDVRVLHENGSAVPFALRGRAVHFFSGMPGTVRVKSGEHEFVHSLTLPQLWETRWDPPESARRGVPRQAAGAAGGGIDVWPWLALAGVGCLLVEWFLFGRFSRGRGAGRLRLLRWRRPAAAPHERLGGRA